MIHSLRFRLLLWLLIPLTLYVSFSTWQAHRSAEQTADLVQDRALLASAQIIAGQIEWIDGALRATVPPSALELFASPDRDQVYYQVVTQSGQLLAGLPSLPLPRGFPSQPPAYYTTDFQGQPVRVIVSVRTMYDSGNAYPVAVTVAQTMQGHDRMLADLWRPALHHQLAMLALAITLALISLTFELRPIVRLKDEVAGRDPMQLAPIRAGRLQLELRPIVDAINMCIQRLNTQVAAQKRFIADAAHQLRTPLTLLDTQIQFAIRLDDRAALAEVLKAMHESSHSMTELTNKLLLLSQAEAANTAAFLRQRVDLVAIVATVLEELVALALRKQIDLGFDASADSAWVEGNAGLLSAMVQNLVDNAIRYTPAGGKVTTTVVASSDEVVLTIQDNGPGIQAEVRDRVFERFYRNAPPEQEGTGLGLAIVKEIVTSSQGTVTLGAGAQGKGLVVTVRLPAA